MANELTRRAPAGQISRVPHLPGLDGLRALAVVAVMVYHANSSWLHGGFLGVEVFFVISGYLITLLLIAEHERAGRIALGQFWLRRARRLLPALFAMLALLMIYLAIWFPRARGRSRGDILGGLSYLSNWYQIWVGAGYTAREAFAPLRHLWSLAVEEQFYLIWPLVMVAILRRGRAHLPRVALWLIGVSVAITIAIAVLYVPGDIDSCVHRRAVQGLVEGRRAVHQRERHALPRHDHACRRTDARRRLRDGVATARAHARSASRTRARQLDVLASSGSWRSAGMMWVTHLADPARDDPDRLTVRPAAVPGRTDDHRRRDRHGDRSRNASARGDGAPAREPAARRGSAPAATGCTSTTGRSTRSSARRRASG